MKILGKTMGKGRSLSDAQGTDRNLSKVIEPGNKYRILFPLVKDEKGRPDILTAIVPGRNLDFKKLGKSFYPLEDFEELEGGKLIDNSGLAPLARISRVLMDAEYNRKVTEKKEEAMKIATASGTDLDQVSLAQSLKELKIEYYGDSEAKPKILAQQSPMISNYRIVTATQVLVIPLSADGTPKFANAVTASLDLGRRKTDQLTGILQNKDYCNPDLPYLEVEYDYRGADKKAAGMNSAFQGVAASLSLGEKFKANWDVEKDTLLSRLCATPEMIASRNMSFTGNVTAAYVQQAALKYISGQKLTLLNIDFEDDGVKRAAADLVKFRIGEDMPTLFAQIVELANKSEDNETDSDETINADVTGMQSKAGLRSALEAGGDAAAQYLAEDDGQPEEAAEGSLGSL